MSYKSIRTQSSLSAFPLYIQPCRGVTIRLIKQRRSVCLKWSIHVYTVTMEKWLWTKTLVIKNNKTWLTMLLRSVIHPRKKHTQEHVADSLQDTHSRL